MGNKVTEEMIEHASAERLLHGTPWKVLADEMAVSESGLRAAVNKRNKGLSKAISEAIPAPLTVEEAQEEAKLATVVKFPVIEPATTWELPEPVASKFAQVEPVEEPAVPATPKVKPMTGRTLVDVQIVALNRKEAASIQGEIERAVALMGTGTFDTREKLWIGLPDTTAAKLVKDHPFDVVIISDETFECRQCKRPLRAHCFSFEHKTRYAKAGGGRAMLPASDWQRDLSRCRFVCRPAEDRKNKGDREDRRFGMIIEGRRFEHEQCRDPFCLDCIALKERAAEIRAEGTAKGERSHILAMEERRAVISAEQRAARARYEASVSSGKTITEAVEEAGLKEDDCPYCAGYKWAEKMNADGSPVLDAEGAPIWVKCQSDWHAEEEVEVGSR